MSEYYDMNGKKIEEGMTLTDGNSYTDLVLACYDEDGEKDLGVDATNWNSPSVLQGLSKPMCYPLSEMDLSELYIKETGNE